MNRTLFIIFILLLGVYGLMQLFSGRGDKSFDAELIAIDTSKVTSLTIDPKGADRVPYTLTKENGSWVGTQGDLNVKAVPSAVSSLLNNLVEVKTKRIAAKKQEKWADYEVDEENGTKVQVYSNGKLLEEFIVGRFSFNQQARSGTSFVRLAGEDEVYAIDGFLTMTFNQDFNAFRSKELLKLSPEMKITEVNITTPEGLELYHLSDGQWKYNGEQVLDSTKVVNYINSFQNLLGTDFADDFDELQASNLGYKSISISGDNILEPLQINCYLDTTRTKPFVFRSSQNVEAYFESDSAGIYSKIFKPVTEFIAE